MSQPAGGATDVAVRLFAAELGRLFQQSVIVQNHRTANTGTENLIRAQPDGYTLLAGGTDDAVRVAANASLRYRLGSDFAAIGRLAVAPTVAFAPAWTTDTLPEIVLKARQLPGGSTFATDGNGSVSDNRRLALIASSGSTFQPIPFRSASAALVDVAGGYAALAIFPLSAALSRLQATPAPRPVAVSRSVALPSSLAGVPTFAALGIAAPGPEDWIGLFAPHCTPADIVAKLHRATVSASQQTEVVTRLAEAGLVSAPSDSPEAFDQQVDEDFEAWRIVGRGR